MASPAGAAAADSPAAGSSYSDRSITSSSAADGVARDLLWDGVGTGSSSSARSSSGARPGTGASSGNGASSSRGARPTSSIAGGRGAGCGAGLGLATGVGALAAAGFSSFFAGVAAARFGAGADAGLTTGAGLAAAAGLTAAGGGAAGSGITTTAAQVGHLPFLPAAARGVRTTPPQPGQLNSIGLVSSLAAGAGVAAGFGAAFGAGAAVAGCFGAGFVAGILTRALQLGHFPFLPAAASGVRTSCAHSGQGNSIVMLPVTAARSCRKKSPPEDFYPNRQLPQPEAQEQEFAGFPHWRFRLSGHSRPR